LFHQGRDGRGVAQARAVIDVVGAEHGSNQFLKQIIIFVRALCRAKPGQGRAPELLFDLCVGLRRQIEGFIPRRFPERLARVVEMAETVGRLWIELGFANQRCGETVAVMWVIEAIASFDTQPAMVHRTFSPGDLHDRIAAFIDAIGNAAPHPAVGTQGVHLL
jgi:hypothetical protein